MVSDMDNAYIPCACEDLDIKMHVFLFRFLKFLFLSETKTASDKKVKLDN